MKSNLDRIIRAVVGLALLVMFFAGNITGIWGILAVVISAVFAIDRDS